MFSVDRRAVRRRRADVLRAAVRAPRDALHGGRVLLALRDRPRLRGGRLARVGAQGRVRPAARPAVLDRRTECGPHGGALHVRAARALPGDQLHPRDDRPVRAVGGAAHGLAPGGAHAHRGRRDAVAEGASRMRSLAHSMSSGRCAPCSAARSTCSGAGRCGRCSAARSARSSASCPGQARTSRRGSRTATRSGRSKTPEEYGRGSLEGVADAGAANNAALAGAWVPALVFGIPGDSITAIVLGIMMMKNLTPGPEIFEKQAVLVHSLYLVFILANLALIPAGLARDPRGRAARFACRATRCSRSSSCSA